jgi:hypothetical protein
MHSLQANAADLFPFRASVYGLCATCCCSSWTDVLCICSKHVRPRRPLGRDPDMDYEFMSDEEWEEEPEGEELDGPDLDDEEDDKDGEDDDDGFMVAGLLPTA